MDWIPLSVIMTRFVFLFLFSPLYFSFLLGQYLFILQVGTSHWLNCIWSLRLLGHCFSLNCYDRVYTCVWRLRYIYSKSSKLKLLNVKWVEFKVFQWQNGKLMLLSLLDSYMWTECNRFSLVSSKQFHLFYTVFLRVWRNNTHSEIKNAKVHLLSVHTIMEYPYLEGIHSCSYW